MVMFGNDEDGGSLGPDFSVDGDGDGVLPGFSSGGVPQPQSDNSNVVRLLIKTNLVEELKYFFLGYEMDVDEDGKAKLRKVSKPMMDREAIHKILGDIKRNVNDVVASGIYDEEVITRRTKTIAKGTVFWIAKVHRKYNIHRSDWERICQTVEETTESILRKAKGGATLETIGNIGTHHEVQTFQQQVPVQQEGKRRWRDYLPKLR